MKEDWPTSRRYPRSLREAFPRDPDYATPIEHTRRTGRLEWVLDVGLAVMIGVVLAALLVAWWSS